MTTIPQNQELLKQLVQLLKAHRHLLIFQRVALLVVAELIVFSRVSFKNSI